MGGRDASSSRSESDDRTSRESYGWEAQIFEHGELLLSHGAFVTKALAVQWAEQERIDPEKGGS